MKFRLWSRHFAPVLLVLLAATPPVHAAPSEPTANELFGAIAKATEARAAEVIGGYARGCIRGAVQLPINGPGWQVMRLSRNRNWGHPSLIRFVEWFAGGAQREGWPGLLIGDMSQPRGGPMRNGHASHQLGLDVDIWLRPAPSWLLSRSEREQLLQVSVLREGKVEIDPLYFGAEAASLIRLAARSPEVERVFVNPGIKKALCGTAAKDDRAWLGKVRPWWGHDAHFHVRLRCPPADKQCQSQSAPPTSDGCGGELKIWLKKGEWRPKELSVPARPMSLAGLPKACRTVLNEP